MAKAIDEDRATVSFEEFVTSLDEDTWAEWVDGEVIRMTPASTRHQMLHQFLLIVMTEFTRANDLGKVLYAPFLVVLPAPRRRGREPDILFIAKEHLNNLKESQFDGAPDLVVEITSPESIGRDRGEKFVEYEASGVREYWLIDPDRQQAEFYQLDDAGRYRLRPPDAEGAYRSVVLPGLWLRVEWLWQQPHPAPISVLKQLGVL